MYKEGSVLLVLNDTFQRLQRYTGEPDNLEMRIVWDGWEEPKVSMKHNAKPAEPRIRLFISC